MTTQPRLVNKQFNSPIGLYSEQNLQDVLEREQRMLANGAIGIDFNNPAVGKPANLQNSAVLRMLEEEENRRGGRTGIDEGHYPRPIRDVSWPPPDYDQKTHLRSSFKDVVIPGAKRVAWPPPQEGVLDPVEAQQNNNAVAQPQGGPYNSNQSPGLHQNNNYSQQATPYHQQPQSYRPLKPLDVSSVGSGSPLASPALNQIPHGYRPTTPGSSKGWAPVHSPATTPLGTGAQKYFGAPQQGYPNQPQYQPVSAPYQAGQFSQPGPYSPQPAQYQQAQPQYQQPQAQYQSPQPQYQQPQYQSPQPQYQQPQYQQPQPQSQYQQPQSQYQQPQPQYQQPQPQYQQPQAQYQQPQPQYQPPQSQYQQAQPQYQQQPSQYQPDPNQAPYQAAVAQTQVAAPRSQPGRQVEPPPSTITLRPSAPVSQAPPPVYSTQPATASLKGGKHLRGDLKWPPENVRQRMDEESKQLMELARGPACRPTRKEKDYTPFFEKHALNSTYPGYKIPPGTQFFRPE